VLGLQPVREAIRVHGAELTRVLVEDRDNPKLAALLRFAKDRGAPTEVVTRQVLERAAAGGRHQGVLAYAPALTIHPLDALLSADALLVVLDGVMDPQNFGAVVRSAVGLGATGVVWPEHSSAPLSPATFRASAGAVEHARLCRVKALPDALDRMAERGIVAVGLDAQATQELGDVDLTGPVALLIGSEDKGLRGPVRKRCQRLARLPMTRSVASLNASVASALALYEALRQRRTPAG
jgi:23S rRNA (guanosine2251-2'-O)-methyltransferase